MIVWLMITKVIQKFFKWELQWLNLVVRLSRDSKNLRKKNDYPSESLFNACYAQKVSVFFFKNEWSFNHFQCNFKSNYVQIAFFFSCIVFQSEENTKKYEPKNISKESIQLFPPKSSLVNCAKIKIVAKEKINLPACLWKKLVMSSARKLFWNY